MRTSTTFHFPFRVLSDVFGVRAGIGVDYHRAQQTTVLVKEDIPGSFLSDCKQEHMADNRG